jgi:putative CocE/NonD family hydrolase
VSGRLHVEHGVLVPMRDGIRLAIDLLRCDGDPPLPVVLVRTPYDKMLERTRKAELYESLARRGYVLAFQDCRGRFNSDGDFFPYMREADDGFDTIEWLAAQEWCSGSVGMIGGSYAGQVQWQAASRTPPHLKAIVPYASPPSCLWRNEPVFNGAFLVPFGEWMVRMGRRSWQEPDFLELFSEQQEYFDALPLADLPAAADTTAPWWDEMMRHPTYDAFWRGGEYDDWTSITAPALSVTGWYDMNFPGAPLNFAAMRRDGGSAAARDGQKLVIGPWPHWVNAQRALNGVDFGEDAIVDLDGYVVRHFDRWLKGIENGVDDEPPVHVFVMGANEWWAESDWPLPDAQDVPFYFHSAGQANTLSGDGGLSIAAPGDEPCDRYRYDPDDPVRVLWNLRDGPVDDRLPAERDDVLCYTSAPLSDPLDVVGPVRCVLYASSSALDTDWHVRLTDVHPDGSARFLCHGVLRARFRNSLEAPELLEPGRAYRFDIDMDATGVRFLPGHGIRVLVTSSWFTKWDRNMNSGAENPFFDDRPVVAEQQVFHAPGRASHIVLPVVRRHPSTPSGGPPT